MIGISNQNGTGSFFEDFDSPVRNSKGTVSVANGIVKIHRYSSRATVPRYRPPHDYEHLSRSKKGATKSMQDHIDKFDYITRSLSKIKHKRWELYVVSRVIHLLDDIEIEFVCQQLVRKPDGKRYLTDLFFPQFGLYLEVDEEGHFNEKAVDVDSFRQADIWEIASLREERIAVYDGDRKRYRSILDVNQDIGNFVLKLRGEKLAQIREGKFIPWDISERYSPEKHILKGFIDVNENVAVRRHVDAISLFGVNYKGWQKGWWNIKGTNKAIWFPRLYKTKTWTNLLSDDGKIITEAKSDGSLIDDYEFSGQIRVVFGRYRNALGETVYKYVGEFLEDTNLSTRRKHIFLKVADRTNLRIQDCKEVA